MHTAAALRSQPRAATDAAEKGGRSSEFWLVFSMLLSTAIFPAISKYYGAVSAPGAQPSSPTAELVWSVMYLVAGIRLLSLRKVAVPLMAKSLLLLALVVTMFVSILWSVLPSLSFVHGVELVGTTVIAYYIVARFTLLEFLQIIALAFGAIAIGSFAMVFGAPGHGRMDWGSGAWTGLYQEKNNLAAAMAIAVITLSILAVSTAPRRRMLIITVLALCTALLVGTRSATAVMGTLVSLAVVAIGLALRSKKLDIGARIAIVSVGLIVVAIVLVVGFTPEAVLALVGRDATLTGRTDFWPYLLQAWSDRPELGFGYDAFFRSPEGADYLSYYVVTSGGWTPYHAHNSYLQVAIDGGIVALTLFVLMLCFGIARSTAYFARALPRESAWPLAIILYLIAGSATETYFVQFNSVEWLVLVAALLYPHREKLQAATRQ